MEKLVMVMVVVDSPFF